MAFSAGYEGIFTVNGVDISAYVEKVTPAIVRREDEMARLGGNQIAFLVGPPKTTLTFNGWQDPVISNLLGPLALAGQATTVPFTVQQQPNAGGPTRTGSGYISKYDEESDATKPAMWTAAAVINGNWA